MAHSWRVNYYPRLCHVRCVTFSGYACVSHSEMASEPAPACLLPSPAIE
jgi:hypothetical protein